MPRLSIKPFTTPQLAFRFKVSITNVELNFPMEGDYGILYGKAASLPKISNNSFEVAHTNAVYSIKGKTKYDPVTLTLYTYSAATAKHVLQWLGVHHGESQGGGTQYTAQDALEGWYDDYKADVQLDLLDEKNEVQESFKLIDAHIELIDFGAVDYEVEQVLNVTLNLRYRYLDYSS